MAGLIHVVATPIGNTDDFSRRALAVLEAVDVVAAEDTRTTGQLLHGLGLRASLVALHDHNEADLVPALIARVLGGESLALVSDAGTPLISDPGYRLVSAAHEAGIRIIPVPGACAAIAALSVAGLASDRFLFEGFLPARSGPRRARLTELAAWPHTLIFYEAPHRIVETLADLADLFGASRQATLARELTKTYETVRRDSLEALSQWVSADANQQRGEIVLVVAGAPARAVEDRHAVSAESLLRVLVKTLPVKQASQLAAEVLGLKKNALYDLAQSLRDAEGTDPA